MLHISTVIRSKCSKKFKNIPKYLGALHQRPHRQIARGGANDPFLVHFVSHFTNELNRPMKIFFSTWDFFKIVF